MIKCSACILQRKAKNCQACRNMTAKLYLDFLTEVRELVFGAKNNNERVYAIQDSITLEEQMISSFQPGNLTEGFTL